MTGACFGIAGESDTVARSRTPSVVSISRALASMSAWLFTLLGKVGKPIPYPFALSSSPSASTEGERLRDPTDDSFRTSPDHLSTIWSKDTFDRLLPSNHLLRTCTRALGFRPALACAAPSKLEGGRKLRSKGGAISRCPIPALAGRAATRAGLSRRFFLVRSRLHQGHLVTLLASFGREDRDRFQRTPVKGCALPRSEMPFFGWTLERRTSQRREPFHHGERAVSQRSSIPRVLPPWSDETSPFAR